jgi:hypothetical protein
MQHPKRPSRRPVRSCWKSSAHLHPVSHHASPWCLWTSLHAPQWEYKLTQSGLQSCSVADCFCVLLHGMEKGTLVQTQTMQMSVKGRGAWNAGMPVQDGARKGSKGIRLHLFAKSHATSLLSCFRRTLEANKGQPFQLKGNNCAGCYLARSSVGDALQD